MNGEAASFSWLQWHFHLEVVIVLLLLEGVYLWGVGPLRRRFGWAEEVEAKQVAWFTGGVIVLYIALTSSIHELADSFLFSAHMVQHLLLVLIAPPMLLVGTPGWLMRPIFRSQPVRRAVRFVTHPLAAFLVFNAILGIWHFPFLYDLTLRSHAPHILEHLLFIGGAVIGWWPILSPTTEVPRASYPIQILYLFGMSLPMGIIGAAITFSPHVLYPWYGAVPRLWGISATTDQQVAGLIMKIPGALFYLVFMTAIFFAWFNKDESGQGETGLEELIGPEESPQEAGRLMPPLP
ncbi:MAG: cytochrome c oxidase assembly protein [Chloroflexi bacterium]|nr:cytochrome c oxidase assembly protein [Chloroflexota bacterium]